MRLRRLPTIILLIDGAVLLALCLRESLTESWAGAIVAGTLGLLFLIGARGLEARRQMRPDR